MKGVLTIEYTSEEMSNAGGRVKQKLSWEPALLTNVKLQLDNKHRLVNSLETGKYQYHFQNIQCHV